MEAVVEVVVMLIADIRRELQLLADNILAEKRHTGISELVAPVTRYAVPRGEVVYPHAIGLLLVTRRTPI